MADRMWLVGETLSAPAEVRQSTADPALGLAGFAIRRSPRHSVFASDKTRPNAGAPANNSAAARALS